MIRVAHFDHDSTSYVGLSVPDAWSHVALTRAETRVLDALSGDTTSHPSELFISQRSLCNRMSSLRRKRRQASALLQAPGPLASVALHALRLCKPVPLDAWCSFVIRDRRRIAEQFRDGEEAVVVFGPAGAHALSGHERDAVAFFANGCSLKEVAIMQDVSVSAANTYVRRACIKLGLQSPRELRTLLFLLKR